MFPDGLHKLIACQPRPADQVQAEIDICNEGETAVDKLMCRYSVETIECSDRALKVTHVTLGLLLAPAAWLLTWLAAQVAFGTLAWVVRGFRRRR